MVYLFNVGAFFVLFREALEAAIILGVLLQYVNRSISHNPTLLQRVKRQVWIGTGLGLVLSILIGIAFTIVFYVLKEDVFGSFESLFEGILQSMAVVLLTWLGFSMISITTWYEKWEKKIRKAAEAKKLDDQGSRSRDWGFMLLAFTVVVREGLESVVFLTGVGQGDPQALIIPGILGIALGILVGYLLYRGSHVLNLRLFFLISSAILFVLAAGLAANAAHEFEEYHYEKVINAGIPEEELEGRPESTPIVWDASGCCSEKKNGFFQILNTLVGWRAKPTVATTVTYFLYWAFVAITWGVLIVLGKKKARETSLSDGTSATANEDRDGELKV
ncbi:high-affinity iron permease [Quaeritorhiza haematococci]|nr:high-affinity iron permease [Quaeritorhiza haematococci]